MSAAAIRRLTAADAAIFHALRMEALTAEPGSFGTSAEEQAGRSLEQVAQTLGDTALFGAFVEGDLVGMAGFARMSPIKEQHKGTVWSMYLRPANRGTGLAAALLDAVIDHARGEVEELRLVVVEDNVPARRLYESRGFVRWGLEPFALKLPDGSYTTDGYYALSLRPR